MPKRIVVGLAGNPNAGKTTMFNELVGAHQHVGNYPGVTVEKKEGHLQYRDYEIGVVDLPGTYSLTASSLDQVVARDYVVHTQPDVIVDVVDASNLERNLYLTLEFLELRQPTIIALNMMDVAELSGKLIDHKLLSDLLGAPVVPTAAARHQGMAELLGTIVEVVEEHRLPRVRMDFGNELEPHLRQLAELIARRDGLAQASPRWIALKLLENDRIVRRMVQERLSRPEEVLQAVDRARAHIQQVIGDDAEIAVADRRYGFISGAVREAQQYDQRQRMDWSEAVDRIVVSRLLGLPIFVLLMWAMFELVFRLGAWPIHWIEEFFTVTGHLASAVLPAGEVKSLVVDGILSGVGGVLVFVPNIILLFLAISIMEDSGYMSRAAFVVDRVMHRIGLHGKSFIPMLIGFGCNVPAIMATRTLGEERDRIVTILVTPLMSCGARLPVYILFAGAFFTAGQAGQVLFSLYALGVILAMLLARLFRTVLFPGPSAPFVMELPPYRLPTLKGIGIHVWERTVQYLKKAGTVILAFAVVMWFLMSYPKPPATMVAGLTPEQGASVALQYSVAGHLGRAIEPVLRPLGFDWRMGVGLLAGFGAKEVVVSTLGTAYSLGKQEKGVAELRSALRADPHLSPLVAYTIMVFVLLYVPCLSCITMIGRETRSWKWPLFTVAYTCTLAWLVAFAVHTVGRLMGY